MKATEKQLKTIKGMIVRAMYRLKCDRQTVMRSLAYSLGDWVYDFNNYTVEDANLVISALRSMMGESE